MDFDDLVDIYGLIIQGRDDSDKRVTYFDLSYLTNEPGGVYTYMKDSDSTRKVTINVLIFCDINLNVY